MVLSNMISSLRKGILLPLALLHWFVDANLFFTIAFGVQSPTRAFAFGVLKKPCQKILLSWRDRSYWTSTVACLPMIHMCSCSKETIHCLRPPVQLQGKENGNIFFFQWKQWTKACSAAEESMDGPGPCWIWWNGFCVCVCWVNFWMHCTFSCIDVCSVAFSPSSFAI